MGIRGGSGLTDVVHDAVVLVKDVLYRLRLVERGSRRRERSHRG